MKLDVVKLTNFRAFDQLALTLGSRLTLFLGVNGSGKTSILDAIAVGLGAILTELPKVQGISFKKYDLLQKNNQQAPFTRVILKTTDGVEWARTEKRDSRKSTVAGIPAYLGLQQVKRYIDDTIKKPFENDQAFVLPVFVYYGVSRALLDVPLRRRGFPKSYSRFEALSGALEADSRFRSAFMWFYHREQDELRLQREEKSFDVQLPELAAIRRAVALLFPGITNPKVETNPLRFVVEQHGEKLDIVQLSDGYKTMLALVIDLASRMALANPHLRNPLEAEAVVMIDEIDLHLHPEWQRRVIGDLLKVFPNAQLLVTTHSPYIVESINNHLQRQQLAGQTALTGAFQHLLPLSTSDVKAYLVGKGDAENMLDPDFGLLDNALLTTFNDIAHQFTRLREMQEQDAGT
jgi:predicted ATP-binding protein involved in virulence